MYNLNIQQEGSDVFRIVFFNFQGLPVDIFLSNAAELNEELIKAFFNDRVMPRVHDFIRRVLSEEVSEAQAIAKWDQIFSALVKDLQENLRKLTKSKEKLHMAILFATDDKKPKLKIYSTNKTGLRWDISEDSITPVSTALLQESKKLISLTQLNPNSASETQSGELEWLCNQIENPTLKASLLSATNSLVNRMEGMEQPDSFPRFVIEDYSLFQLIKAIPDMLNDESNSLRILHNYITEVEKAVPSDAKSVKQNIAYQIYNQLYPKLVGKINHLPDICDLANGLYNELDDTPDGVLVRGYLARNLHALTNAETADERVLENLIPKDDSIFIPKLLEERFAKLRTDILLELIRKKMDKFPTIANPFNSLTKQLTCKLKASPDSKTRQRINTYLLDMANVLYRHTPGIYQTQTGRLSTNSANFQVAVANADTLRRKGFVLNKVLPTSVILGGIGFLLAAILAPVPIFWTLFFCMLSVMFINIGIVLATKVKLGNEFITKSQAPEDSPLSKAMGEFESAARNLRTNPSVVGLETIGDEASPVVTKANSQERKFAVSRVRCSFLRELKAQNQANQAAPAATQTLMQ